jgi:hypothetical protein
MAKHTYHFKHDFNAHNDEKIIDLRMGLGFEGYGIFWYLVEILANTNEYKLETNYKRIGFSSNTKPELIQKVVEEYALFSVKDGFFWSESLNERMTKLDEIKLKRANAGSKGGKVQANAKQMLSKSEANGSRVKESKGEKRKEEESKGDSLPTLQEILDYCYLVRNLYFFDAWDFFYKNDSNNWYMPNDKGPIKNWKNYLSSWSKKEYAEKVNQENHGVLITEYLKTIENKEQQKEALEGFKKCLFRS